MQKSLAHTFQSHQYRSIASYALIVSCLALALLYSINLYSVISHTVSLKSIRANLAALNSQIEELDGQYLSLTSNITPETLGKYGLSQGKVSMFIKQTASFGKVSMSVDEL